MTSLGFDSSPRLSYRPKQRQISREHSASIPIVVVGRARLMDFKEIVRTYSVNRPTAAGDGNIQEEKPENELKC